MGILTHADIGEVLERTDVRIVRKHLRTLLIDVVVHQHWQNVGRVLDSAAVPLLQLAGWWTRTRSAITVRHSELLRCILIFASERPAHMHAGVKVLGDQWVEQSRWPSMSTIEED